MVQNFSDFCGGEFWDESITLNQSWPEFTECFQNTALVWGPCGWLWFMLPFNLYYLLTKTNWTPIPLSRLNIAKSFISLVLFFIAIVDLIEADSIKKDEFEVDVPITNSLFVANSIRAATFLLSAMLIQLERKRGSITSGTQFIFWLLITIAGIIPFYTYIINGDGGQFFRMTLFYIYFGLIFVQFILHFFAERITRMGYHELERKQSPEATASFLSRVTFWWINGLVLTGYRKSLEEKDLWELHLRDKNTTVIPVFHKAWKKEVQRCKEYEYHTQQTVAYAASLQNERQKKNHRKSDERTPLIGSKGKEEEVIFKGGKKMKATEPSLFRVLANCYSLDLLKSFGLKCIYDLLQFVSPMILNVLIEYTQNKDNDFVWKGYVFACSFFVVAVLQSCLFHQTFHYGMSLGMRIRSALVSAVYKKALTMSNEARKEKTAGEIVNLMSVDCQRIQDITGYLWMLFSAPLQISLALFLLYQTIGSSVFAGLAIMILLMPINAVIAMKQRKLQVLQMKFKDSRIKLMNEVLNGIKVLKLYAWEPAFQDKVADIRKEELSLLKKTAYLNAFSNFCWACAPYLVTLATFTTYILTSESHYLDAQTAFVALSLFNILRFPMNLLPMIVSYVVQAQVSVGRLGQFLRTSDLDPDNVILTDLSDNAISVTGGTFTWDKNMTTTSMLKNIDVDIPTGKLVAIVGHVGAGKSSMLSAFLGEMEKLEGKVTLNGNIAYVSQQAWIQNATLKDNILFGKAYEKKKYEKVLEACALGPDLQILPGGDETEIGEKGINLSGGQKQRVSVARAVYNNADVYLMDDPLSAVDSHVGKHMFQKVIGSSGLLRNKTRVLVTHDVHWLPMVDMVVVMDDGKISEMGTFDELLSHDGAFAQFLKIYLTVDNDNEDNDPEIQKMRSQILERVDSVTSDAKTTSADEAENMSTVRRRLSRQSSESSTGLPRSASRVDKAAKKGEYTKPGTGNKLIEDEKSETGKVKLQVYLKYSRSIGYMSSFIILLVFTLYQTSAILANVWLSEWTDDAYLKSHINESNTSEYQAKNALYLGVYGGLGAFQAIFVLVYLLICSTRMVYAAGILHTGMLNNILKCPMSFFDTTPIGRIVNRFSRDVEIIDNSLPQTVRQWLNSTFAALSTLIVISYSTPIFLAVVLPIALFYFLIQRFFIPTSRQLKRLESTTRSPIYTHFSETISGAATIRAFRQQDRFIQDSLDRVDRNIVFYFAGISCNRWLGFRLEFVGNFIVLAAALFAVLTDVSGGLVGLSVSYALQVTGALNFMVRFTSDLETNVVSVERVKEYSEAETEAAWILPFHRPPHDWPDNGAVSFQDYATRYRKGLDLVLKGVTFNIQGGEKIGIVGRTGAGKSSLTLSLFRLVEAAGGAISIDNQQISEMGLHDLRTKITILPQDPVLFSGTLRMNLDPLDIYMDDNIWQALEHSHLKKFVTELPDQLQHECGEGGQNLSVGQRQLVCLARTLLRKTRILILDEATAAVDMETDDLIQQTICTEFKDCTVITIAHRLNTIMDYDRVMVLDAGRIKEFDKPATLLEDKSSSFFSMVKDAGLPS